MPKVYIAGPFFNEEQVALIAQIEEILTIEKIDFFSPRSFGVLINMTDEERKANIKAVYKKNIEEICECSVMLAVIDDRDVGTIFEIGYASALKHLFKTRRIVTISNKGYGMNVMLRESVDAHLNGLTELANCMRHAVDGNLFGEKFMADRGQTW